MSDNYFEFAVHSDIAGTAKDPVTTRLYKTDGFTVRSTFCPRSSVIQNYTSVMKCRTVWLLFINEHKALITFENMYLYIFLVTSVSKLKIR
jgi:hypothetical protein